MITLQNSRNAEVTVLTNNFIDNYMPEANGEFVKVYIYLLRLLSDASVPFSLEQMADHFFCTERDIVRALKYWEKVNLLTLTYRSNEDITDITLNVPPVKSDVFRQFLLQKILSPSHLMFQLRPQSRPPDQLLHSHQTV